MLENKLYPSDEHIKEFAKAASYSIVSGLVFVATTAAAAPFLGPGAPVAGALLTEPTATKALQALKKGLDLVRK